MATNKWLNDIKTLKLTTDMLRETLRYKNIPAYDTDTLPELVSKVPNLAPITLSEDEKWQPDPLWVFPDPNGSNEMKTIRQIYDEDTMASSYTYRAIYQIRGDIDTIDLKKVFGAISTAQTFVLSDGTVYEKVTTTTLTHTWDKNYDVEDSKGNKMRYIRFYSNYAWGYVSGIYGLSVWVIHNGSTSITSTNQYSNGNMEKTEAYLPYLECLEFGNKVTNITALPGGMKFVKLKCDGTVNSFGAQTSNYNNIKELSINSMSAGNITSEATSGSSCFTYWIGLKYLDFSGFNITDYLYLTGSRSLSSDMNLNWSIEEIRNLESLPIAKLQIGCFGKITRLSLPKTVTDLIVTSMPNLEELIIPENVTTLSIYGQFKNLNKIVLNSNVATLIWSLDNNASARVRDIVVPIDFNIATNFSSHPNLTHDSLVNMLTNLKDLSTETSKKLTLGSTNLAKLTDEEKNIALNKNWTLA